MCVLIHIIQIQKVKQSLNFFIHEFLIMPMHRKIFFFLLRDMDQEEETDTIIGSKSISSFFTKTERLWVPHMIFCLFLIVFD
jgi:hypothetical protein